MALLVVTVVLLIVVIVTYDWEDPTRKVKVPKDDE